MQAKTKKIVIISSVIGIAAVAAFILLRGKRKKIKEKIQAGSPDVVQPAKQTTTAVIFPLKKGSGTNTAEKNAVKVVQRYINAKSAVHWWLSIVPLAEDGIFGPLTETALNQLSGVKEVSYSFYKEMLAFLNPSTPSYLFAPSQN